MSFIEQQPPGARGSNRQFAARDGHLAANPREFKAWSPSTLRTVPQLLADAPAPLTAPSLLTPLADDARTEAEDFVDAPLAAVAAPLAATAASAATQSPLQAAVTGPDESCLQCAQAARELAERDRQLEAVTADNRALARLLAQLAQMDEGRIEALREEVQHAATTVALKIIGRSIDINADWLRDQVLNELQHVEALLNNVRVTVNPVDYALLVDDWQTTAPQASLHASDSVSRGGFVIETPHESIDGDPRSRILWADHENSDHA